MKLLLPVVLPFAVFLTALWLTGRFRRYALAQSLLDVPNARSSHAVATPRGGGVAIVLIPSAIIVYRRRRTHMSADVSAVVALPENITPLTVLMTLRRLAVEDSILLDAQRHAKLEEEISRIELNYFGPGENPAPNGDLTDALGRWMNADLAGQPSDSRA